MSKYLNAIRDSVGKIETNIVSAQNLNLLNDTRRKDGIKAQINELIELIEDVQKKRNVDPAALAVRDNIVHKL